MSPTAVELLSASGGKLVQQIGIEVVRDVVHDVLTGKNLRDSTEAITRRRIAALNLATVEMFMKGTATSAKFVQNLPQLASKILQRKRVTKSERWLAQWALGLTDKAFQNVLRDDPSALIGYREQYVRNCQEVIAECEREYGELSGVLELDSGVKAEINWLFLVYLLNTVGSQALTIRGSEKSAYGKLFEKLVLGSLLDILGFKHVSPEHPGPFHQVFWLASQGERRESDATLLYQAGKGVRFDIGFIGRGNPEISLDKVSRFEREISLGSSKWYMGTIIIVDRIGTNSRIERLAKDIGGTVMRYCYSDEYGILAPADST
ncbi:MAG: hypothetical protein DDT27_00487 [Dehalococcoidia bacterium]|nr:hypothetical protein [Chloroflexota bacterium]